jgi:uncharacterized protein (TIGR00251 family)
MLTRLKVRVVPDARRNEIAGFFQGEVRLKVRASAQEGKANAEVIRFLAELIDCQRSKIAIKQGEKSRNKMIEIIDVNPEEVQRKLEMRRKQKPEAGI